MAGVGAGGAAGGGGPLAGLASLFAGNSLLAIAAGLIVGVIGTGTLLATGAVHVGGGTAAPAAPAGGLQLVACPDVGPVIGTIPQGEKVLVTGRTADGAWLQVFYPGPAFDRAWTKAGPLQLEADASGLPVASCEAPPTPTPRPTPGASTAVVASPEASPSAEPSAVAASPSPSPGPSPSPSPGASPSPSPTPNLPPAIAGFTASTKALSYDQGAYCPTATQSATFTLKASDAGGVSSATLYWRKPGASSYTPLPMSLAGGSAQSGTWTATVDTKTNGSWDAGNLAAYVLVLDASGARTKSPTTGALAIPVTLCVNTGPSFTSGPSAGDANLYADPRNVGCGSPIGTEISATITDIDGVKSATLVFTDQAGATVQRPMTGYAGNLWTSSINANTDGTQGPGTFTWYVVAVDGKGMPTTSATQSIQVTRCDSAARIGASLSSPPLDPNGANAWGTCPSPVLVVFAITAVDPDSPGGPLQVKVSWTLTRVRPANQQSGVVSGVQLKGSSYSATIPGSETQTWCQDFYGFGETLAYTVTTTDQYGGVTQRSFKATISIYTP